MKLYPNWLKWPQTGILIEAFGDESDKLRFVGGAVRDCLLGIDAGDVDIATSLTPREILGLLEKANIPAILTGIKYGTVIAVIAGKHFEITTLRHDIACDGRHAEVIFTDNWREDAARRDFTMNALYLSADGELFDYFSGIDDARSGYVRFIGDAGKRITEDYLRILRFFRFFAYYGKGMPDEEAISACAELTPGIKTLSGERIAHEMLKLLAAPEPYATLELMQSSCVLEYVCGFKINLKTAIDKVGKAELRLALLLLLADIEPARALELLATRWRLPNQLKKSLLILATNVNYIVPDLPLTRQKHLLRTLGAEIFSSLLLLKMALEPEENYSSMMDLAAHWQPPIMPVSGKDLIGSGIPEGEKLGEQLRSLEMLWEESDYTLTREELLHSIK